MPFLLLFALSWSAFAVFADKSRWRQFLPATMLAMLMSFSSDVMMYSYPLWVYKDETGLLSIVFVHLLDDWGIYPVTTYLFLQYFPAKRSLRAKFFYFVAWTTGVILLEMLFCQMGWMKHQLWWTIYFSYSADWLIFFTLLRFHLLYNSQRNVPLIHASDLTAQLKIKGTKCKETIRRLGLELYPLLEQPNLQIILFEIPKGTTVPNHFHQDDECFMLLQGKLELVVGDETYQLVPGQLVNMGKNIAHSVQSVGHESALLLSIFLPAELHDKWNLRTQEEPHNAPHALSF